MMKLPVSLPLAVLSIALAGAALAEPAKVGSQKPAPTLKPARELVLASADSVPSPATDRHLPTTSSKRIAPRVTTCRCGDLLPDSETPDR
jgi:hypothetical protein